MLRRATAFLFVMALLVGPALAQQQVTVREINDIPDDQLQNLQNGNFSSQDDTEEFIFNDLEGETVQFTAVIMSNPRNSGLSTPTDGFPGRVHVFVRDTTAASAGVEGMGIQLVDGDYQSTGLLSFGVGDMVTITGEVGPFGTVMQVSPSTLELVDPGTYDQDRFDVNGDFGAPVVIQTSDANAPAGTEGQVIVNWANLENLRGQYVRLEGATLQARNISDARPDWTVTTDGGTTVLPTYDTSLRFRNDQSDYDSDAFNVREDDFVPPPPGSVVNLQGYMTYTGFDPFANGDPDDVVLNISPMEDADLEVTQSPPVITSLAKPEGVPGADPVEVTVDVTADPSRTLDTVQLGYYTSSNADTSFVDPTSSAGTSYTFEIPAQPDGDFVVYFVTATDNTGAQSSSDDATTRFLAGGINEVEDIQLTFSGGPGDSPFTDSTVPMDLNVTLQTDPTVSGFYVVQTDVEGPWSGVLLTGDGLEALNQGDQLNITEATVVETFGVTELDNVQFSVTGSGDPLGYKVVPTSVLTSSEVAEAHEGMMLRFEDVTITSADAGFGEWAFSSDGTEDNEALADDASNAIPGDFNTSTFEDGDVVSFIQGIWWFSFGSYKLLPESGDDIGDVNVSVEDGTVPGSFALDQNYPNPFNPETSIRYEVGSASPVTLTVYDVLGREVAMLVNRQQPAGTYTVTFDAQRLPSGLYLYRLEAGGQTFTRTMMLLK